MTEAQDRFRELRAENQRLTAELAETAEFSAGVHEHAARVHEQLGEASMLDPSELRAHAQRDREFAERERERLRRSGDDV